MWADVVSFEVGTQCVSRHCQAFLSSYKDAGEQCEAAACIVFFCRFDLELWLVLNDTDRCESTLFTPWYHEEV